MRRLAKRRTDGNLVIKKTSYIAGLQLVREDILTSRQNVPGFESLSNFHLGIKRFSKYEFLRTWDLKPYLGIKVYTVI